jgi:hypothetical protein
MLHVPPATSSYLPENVSRLRVVFNSLRDVDPVVLKTATDLREARPAAPRFLGKVTSTETNAVRPFLNAVFQLLHTLVNNIQVQVVEGEAVASRFKSRFCLAKPSSSPEPTLMADCFILVGSEAKGFDASAFSCMKQGYSLCGDGAIALRRFGVANENCVVPGVFAFGDSIQLYAVFLLELQFPCLCLLSDPLSLDNPSHRLIAAKWLHVIAAHVQGLLKVLPGPTTLTQAEAKKRPPHRATLNLQNYFVKPVRAALLPAAALDPETAVSEECLPFRQVVSDLLFKFHKLDQVPTGVPDHRRLIHFPVGWLQQPRSDQQQIRDTIKTRVTELGFKVHGKRQPYILFPFLRGWRILHPALVGDHAEALIPLLSAARQYIAACGLVHMDLRPANVMWHCSCLNSELTTIGEHSVELKVIDWEHALCVGTPVPLEWVDVYRNDQRYPLSALHRDQNAQDIVASLDLMEWAEEQIVNFLKQPLPFKEFSQFCGCGACFPAARWCEGWNASDVLYICFFVYRHSRLHGEDSGWRGR